MARAGGGQVSIGTCPFLFQSEISGARGLTLEQARAIGDIMVRADQNDAFVVLPVGEAQTQEFGHERSDLFFGKVDNARDLTADQLFGGVIFGDLG